MLTTVSASPTEPKPAKESSGFLGPQPEKEMMGKTNLNSVFRIRVTESERGWSCDSWVEDYPTYDAALNRIREINSKNTSEHAPNYYMIADERIFITTKNSLNEP